MKIGLFLSIAMLYQCSFAIKCSARNMLLRAITPIEMQRWMKLLRQYTSYAHGGDGTTTDFSVIRTKTPKRNGTSLGQELDRALTQLNNLQVAKDREAEEDMDVLELNLTDSVPRGGVAGGGGGNKLRERQTNIVPADLNVKSGGAIIMSSDAEISLGKSYAPLPGIRSKDRSDRTLNVDSEIVIGKKSTAIVYYDCSNDADDDVLDFSVLPDEEEFKYQEQLLRRAYYDGVESASPKEDECTGTTRTTGEDGKKGQHSPESKSDSERKSSPSQGSIPPPKYPHGKSPLLDISYTDCK